MPTIFNNNKKTCPQYSIIIITKTCPQYLLAPNSIFSISTFQKVIEFKRETKKKELNSKSGTKS